MGIEERTREAGKTYSFDESHDTAKPAEYWFQNPPEGLTLFVVFYTKACRWSKCAGCNLPSKMSEHLVSFDKIMGQIDHLFDVILSDEQKKNLKKIIISNNGSILDEDTFSTTALMYFMAKMNINCPNISKLTMETRPEYVDFEELEVLSRALAEGDTKTELELAVGFEAFDDKVRNDYFYKGLSLDKFEKMVEKLAKYKFGLKTYFMVKPVPEMSEEDAVEDIMKAIDYLKDISERYPVDINMHLNPTYVAYGTELEDAFKKGEFTPPTLESVKNAVLTAENKNISIFVGLNDEGLAVPGGSFIREGDKALQEKLAEFNRTQNYDLLK